MQAEQCFAVAHKMDRKSIWPVCVGAWHTPVYLGGDWQYFACRLGFPRVLAVIAFASNMVKRNMCSRIFTKLWNTPGKRF